MPALFSLSTSITFPLAHRVGLVIAYEVLCHYDENTYNLNVLIQNSSGYGDIYVAVSIYALICSM